MPYYSCAKGQAPALFARVKSSWIRGFAVPADSSLRICANCLQIFANLNLQAHAQTQRSKMLFTPSKRIMQGGPLAKNQIMKKHSVENSVQIFLQKSLT